MAALSRPLCTGVSVIGLYRYYKHAFEMIFPQSGLQRVVVQAHIAHLTQFPRGIFVTYIHGTTPLRQIRSISGDTMWGRLDIVQQRSVINTGFVATTSFSGIGYLLTIIGCNKTLT